MSSTISLHIIITPNIRDNLLLLRSYRVRASGPRRSRRDELHLDAFLPPWQSLISLSPRAHSLNDHFPDPIVASGPGYTLSFILQ